MELSNLSDEILLKIGIYCESNTFLFVNRRLYNIFNDNYFWREKFRLLFPCDRCPKENPKEHYIYHRTLFGTGERESLAYDKDLSWKLLSTECFESIAVGRLFTVALDIHGQLWGVGENRFGQLSKDMLFVPELRILDKRKFQKVYANRNQTVLIDRNDQIWSSGVGPLPCSSEFTQLNFKAKHASMSFTHILFQDEQNSIWAAGLNLSGELGLGHQQIVTFPERISGLLAQSIAAGNNFSAFVDMEGQLWVSGLNKYGQLGLTENQMYLQPTRVQTVPLREVSAGHNYLLLIDQENRLWSAGLNYQGQLGIGNDLRHNTFKLVSDTLKVAKVSTGMFHALIQDLQGHLWVMGGNYFGQIGLGHAVQANIPIKIRFTHRIREMSAGISHSRVIID